MIITILMLIIIIIFYYCINNEIKEGFKPTLYKLDPSQKIYTSISDCNKYCSNKDCLNMKRRMYIIDKCLECKKKGLCLSDSLIEPVCIKCNEIESNKECLRDRIFACPNPNNIYSMYQTKPYFLINKVYNNINSSTNDTCNFCWNF